MAKETLDVNSQFALRLTAGLVAGGTETVYDISSYIIGKLLSLF